MKTILVFVAVVAIAIAQQPSTRVLPADVLRGKNSFTNTNATITKLLLR